jgi:lysophospholipase L1-like esterase
MLVRFRQDVIALAPQAVVILAGTNDIAGNSGPMTLDETEAHYTSMAELARLHGIRVIFSSILPVHNYTPRSDITFPLRPPARIAELNRWLKAYCAANGHVYLDYVPATVDDKGWLKRDLADDGLHPGPAGYGLMAALAQAAIDRALASSPPQAASGAAPGAGAVPAPAPPK